MYFRNAGVSLDHNKVSHNSATYYGGGLLIDVSDMRITSTSFNNNGFYGISEALKSGSKIAVFIHSTVDNFPIPEENCCELVASKNTDICSMLNPSSMCLWIVIFH